MSILTDEINACGIICVTLNEGFPITDPPYDQLSSGDQAIVDACIACSGKNFTSAERTALWALLDSEQKTAYTECRDKEIEEIWFEYLELPEHKKLRVLYIYKAGSKQDMIVDFEDNIEGMFPLWSDT
jgi:hypothetical protein